MQINSKLKELLCGAVAAAGYELWGAETIHADRQVTLRVYIEKNEGVNIDDCEKASHQISAVLETEQIDLEHYVLEVSSPGLYRPLYTLEQYQKYIGEKIKLKLKHKDEFNRKNFSGILTKVDGKNIVINTDKQDYFFELSEIADAHLNPDIFKSKSEAR